MRRKSRQNYCLELLIKVIILILELLLVEMTNLCAQKKDGSGWSAEATEAFLCFNYNGALLDQWRDLPNTVTLLSLSSPAPFLPGPTAKLSNF